MTAENVKTKLQERACVEDAQFLQRFFKTSPGQYGEGDVFIGVRVPATREVCKNFKDLPVGEIQKLLDSKVHEHRLAGLVILAEQFKKADQQMRRQIYEFYLQNAYQGRVNNWDLVDVSAPNIIGEYLAGKPRDILFELAKSKDIWQKRVAVLATFTFIKRGQTADSIKIAELLLHDEQDLIQKAVGWMLRELGKKADQKTLLRFLDGHAHEMPRTMLRYSIERLTLSQKQFYMRLKEQKNG